MATDQSTQYMFLVDDEPIQNEMLKDYLSDRFRYKIKTFGSGEDASRNWIWNPLSLYLTFTSTPTSQMQKTAWDVLQDIKQLKPNSQVIMLSGQDKLEVAVDSMKYGAYDT